MSQNRNRLSRYIRPSTFSTGDIAIIDPTVPIEKDNRQGAKQWLLHWDHSCLAKDPNRSLESLLHWAVDYPGEVANNPAFRLGVLIEPDRLKTASIQTQVALVGWWEINPAIIRFLASSRKAPIEVRCAAANNPQCPQDLLWAYLLHARPVRMAVRHNPRAPRELVREISRIDQAHIRKGQKWRVTSVSETSANQGEPLPECTLDSSVQDAWSSRWCCRSQQRQRRSL